MSHADQDSANRTILSDRFPPTTDTIDNPAIELYGRRFYKDQTPVEYLAEFLLVFASPKTAKSDVSCSLNFKEVEGPPYYYWPDDRVALKLFAFFPSSKLETRHPVHQKAYLEAINDIREKVSGSDEEKDDAIRLLQSLFGGFVGVARNRTWVTHSFLPASFSLLSREVDWLHSKAVKDDQLQDWDGAKKYFATDRHNFMARGGELLFLQLAHLFSCPSHKVVERMCEGDSYRHLRENDLGNLREDIEAKLEFILGDAVGSISELSSFVEEALSGYQLQQPGEGKRAPLGWVPAATAPEAFLFASELRNICSSTLGALEKIDLLQTLACMQVLRSLCFQAERVDQSVDQTDIFFGGYSWIVADINLKSGSAVGKLAQNSFDSIEAMLYRVLRQVGDPPPNFTEADKHGFQIFRKLAKELGLVVPRTGKGQRFVLPPQLLRFLVAALVKPGERVRLTEFYSRAFAHYGIALGNRQLAIALGRNGPKSGVGRYAVASDTTWVEEALHQGGFLVELSDAVSIVHNPGCEER